MKHKLAHQGPLRKLQRDFRQANCTFGVRPFGIPGSRRLGVRNGKGLYKLEPNSISNVHFARGRPKVHESLLARCRQLEPDYRRSLAKRLKLGSVLVEARLRR